MNIAMCWIMLIASIACFFFLVEVAFLLFLQVFRLVDNYFQERYWAEMKKNKETVYELKKAA